MVARLWLFRCFSFRTFRSTRTRQPGEANVLETWRYLPRLFHCHSTYLFRVSKMLIWDFYGWIHRSTFPFLGLPICVDSSSTRAIFSDGFAGPLEKTIAGPMLHLWLPWLLPYTKKHRKIKWEKKTVGCTLLLLRYKQTVDDFERELNGWVCGRGFRHTELIIWFRSEPAPCICAVRRNCEGLSVVAQQKLAEMFFVNKILKACQWIGNQIVRECFYDGFWHSKTLGSSEWIAHVLAICFVVAVWSGL